MMIKLSKSISMFISLKMRNNFGQQPGIPNPGPPRGGREEVNVSKQLKEFWKKVGLFTRICFIINVSVYFYQLLTKSDLKQSAICLGPIYDSFQFYRIISSEFTHANPAHIVFNMSGLLLFGVNVENTYGSAFYFAINVALIVISTLISLTFYLVLSLFVPQIYRGGPQNFYNCGVGYSNVMFGLAMIFSYVGDEPYQNLFGICRLDKKLIPWIYMLMIYFTIPDSSFLGHFCGLIAGLMIKFSGVYKFMPRYEWIKEFDEVKQWDREGSSQMPGYYPATEAISTDFDSYMWSQLWRKLFHITMRIRQRLFGYNYIPEPPEPVICPNSIELEDRRQGSTRLSVDSF